MCLAVVGKVLKIDKLTALADIEGNHIIINIQLTPNVEIGQYILIHAGFAIETMPENEFVTAQTLLTEIARMVNHDKC
ncbi:MAG: HypC/HybG/HupF family hydrogenase formation chaperone [Pelosinus sp.]|nr:HypC/HybG/HupF family hydrogenase formation chaperone [Pelosinus sp.]